jgi:hypothetical protein
MDATPQYFTPQTTLEVIGQTFVSDWRSTGRGRRHMNNSFIDTSITARIGDPCHA